MWRLPSESMFVVLTVIATMMSGCGSSGSSSGSKSASPASSTATASAPASEPAPSTAEIAQLNSPSVVERIDIACSFSSVGPPDVDQDVKLLTDLFMRDNPDAPFELEAGAGTIALRELVKDVEHELRTNDCAPQTADMLQKQTGVPGD